MKSILRKRAKIKDIFSNGYKLKNRVNFLCYILAIIRLIIDRFAAYEIFSLIQLTITFQVSQTTWHHQQLKPQWVNYHHHHHYKLQRTQKPTILEFLLCKKASGVNKYFFMSYTICIQAHWLHWKIGFKSLCGFLNEKWS